MNFRFTFCLLSYMFVSTFIAQEKNNVKLDIEIGLLDLLESESLGLFLNVEPKLKSSENTVIGLRIGLTLNSQTIENTDSLQFNIDDRSDNGVISFVPTIDYFFNEHKYRPNLGLGLGVHLLTSYIDVSRIDTANPSEDEFEVNVNYQPGFLLRGGFELGKTRIGLEYNFVPKADIAIPNGQIIGTVDTSYFGLSLGYSIGGWKI